MFDSWKAALSSGEGGAREERESVFMDVDLPNAIQLSTEILLSPIQSNKYADILALLATRMDSGNVRMARSEISNLFSLFASETSSFLASPADISLLSNKLCEAVGEELIEVRNRAEEACKNRNGLLSSLSPLSGSSSSPSPSGSFRGGDMLSSYSVSLGKTSYFGYESASEVVHTQIFQSAADLHHSQEGKASKSTSWESMLHLLSEVREKVPSFSSLFASFLLASHLPQSFGRSMDVEDKLDQDELFQILMRSEEALNQEEVRNENELESPTWLDPYISLLDHLAQKTGNDVKDIFAEDMEQMAAWQLNTWNRLISLACRYLPSYCVGHVPFVSLVFRTCLPSIAKELQSSLLVQTYRLCGDNLLALLTASTSWDTFAQHMFWNAVSAEYMFQAEPLQVAMVEWLAALENPFFFPEALQGALLVLGPTGPSSKILQVILQMDLRAHTFSTAMMMRWMVSDETQSDLVKLLPSALTAIAKLDSKSDTSPSIRKAVMHLSLAYAVVPGDLELLFSQHPPLRRHLTSLLTKGKCSDSSFDSLRSSLTSLGDDKEKEKEKEKEKDFSKDPPKDSSKSDKDSSKPDKESSKPDKDPKHDRDGSKAEKEIASLSKSDSKDSSKPSKSDKSPKNEKEISKTDKEASSSGKSEKEKSSSSKASIPSASSSSASSSNSKKRAHVESDYPSDTESSSKTSAAPRPKRKKE